MTTEKKPMPQCLVITGFSRSGTSVTASLLKSAGLHIGDNLLAPAISNKRGLFEDIEFLKFHRDVLSAHGKNSDGFLLENNVPVPQEFRDRAENLVRSREAEGKAWGWKEPRTCLFLKFWKKLIPHARFLFSFRSPWEVVDSLFRRGDRVFHDNPSLAVECWFAANQAILDFVGEHPESCVLVESYVAAQQPKQLIEELNRRFSLNLGLPSNLFESDLFRHDESSPQVAAIEHGFPKACKMLADLRQRAAIGATGEESRRPVSVQDPTWPMKLWLESRLLRHKVENAEIRLKQSEENLKLARQDLAKAAQQIHWMESSKFWKLRDFCSRVRPARISRSA